MTNSTRNQSAEITLPKQKALFGGLTFVIMLLIVLVTLPPLINLYAENTRDHFVNDVIAFNDTLTATENDLQEMQAATRGYLLTHAPSYLNQYYAAREQLAVNLQQLSHIAPYAEPSLEAKVATLAELAEHWQREGSEHQLALLHTGQKDDAIEAVASGPSQALFDTFRSEVNDLRAQTEIIKGAVLEDLNRTRRLQVALTSGLGMLGLLAGAMVIFGFRRMRALMHDLQTERLRTATLAAQSHLERQRLQALFDHSPEGLVFAEAPNGQIVLVNQAANTLLGPELLGSNVQHHPMVGHVYWPDGDVCAHDDLPLVRALKYGEETRSLELLIEQPSGHRIPVLVTSIPIRTEDGTLRGAMAILQDLRHLHEVERLKSDFVALVSHELRTPLTAIQGCAQALLRGSEFDPLCTREFLQIITEQGDRLQELIDNLLNLSQVEAGMLRLSFDVIQPQHLVQHVLRQLRPRVRAVRLQADFPPTLPWVHADPRRIEQVLLNLIDNACKFSPSGGVITISASASDTELTISVRDQGPGIPPTDHERIFERFYRVAQPTTQNVGGTGLGLAICKALVEAHGGRIWVDPTSTIGTTICFTLPVALVEPSQTSATEHVYMRPRQQADKLHLLVIDDDPALRRLLESSLRDVGYTVHTAIESQTAIQSVVQHPPDAILLDLMLPGEDGFALCKELREWTKVPIIMLTARSAEKDIVLGLQLGADDYVTKPFRMNELVARIEAVLRRTRNDVRPGELSVIQIGNLIIDLALRRVTVDGALVNLTPIEYQILAYLARNAGQVLTREQILAEVWGESCTEENNYLWVHMANLRKKIEPKGQASRYIITERGVGYRLAKDPSL